MALVCGFPMYDSCEWTNPSDFEEIAHLLLIFPGSVLGSFPMRISLLAVQFEIQQLNLKGARQILGNAIGKAPKDKVIYMLSFSIYYIINLGYSHNCNCAF
jgi:hypothetical protein